MEIIGIILTIAFWIGLLCFVGWVAWKIDRWGLKNGRRKRERDIETAMRLGMADAQAQQRVAQRIMNERG